MANDLQRTLSELSDLVPIVPLRVSELLEAGQALRRRAEDALERVEALPEAAAELRDAMEETAREALEEMREADEERQERTEDLQEACGELTESLEEWSESLEEATEGTREHLGRLERAFAQDGKITVAEEHTGEGLDAEGQRHLASAERLAAIQQDYGQAHQQLGARIGACAGRLASAFTAAAERIQEIQQQVADGVSALEEGTREGQQELGSALAAVAETMEVSLSATGEDFGARLRAQQSDAAVPVWQAPATAANTADVARQAAAGALATHELLDPLFEGVSSLLHPVETAIDAVKAAASLVGLNLS